MHHLVRSHRCLQPGHHLRQLCHHPAETPPLPGCTLLSTLLCQHIPELPPHSQHRGQHVPLGHCHCSLVGELLLLHLCCSFTDCTHSRVEVVQYLQPCICIPESLRHQPQRLVRHRTRAVHHHRDDEHIVIAPRHPCTRHLTTSHHLNQRCLACCCHLLLQTQPEPCLVRLPLLQLWVSRWPALRERPHLRPPSARCCSFCRRCNHPYRSQLGRLQRFHQQHGVSHRYTQLLQLLLRQPAQNPDPAEPIRAQHVLVLLLSKIGRQLLKQKSHQTLHDVLVVRRRAVF